MKTKTFHYLKTIIPVPKHVTAGTLKGKILPGGTNQAACAHQASHIFQIREIALRE